MMTILIHYDMHKQKRSAQQMAFDLWENLGIGETGSGLWIQTSNIIGSDSVELHRQLYRLIADCTYPPDQPTLRKYARLQPWLMEKFPMTEEAGPV